MAKYGRRWEVFKMYGIEQKLKIIRHAERYGTASCCDAFDVKARTLRHWRRLYREAGAAALSDGRKGGSGRPKGRQRRLRLYRLSATTVKTLVI
ncbi:MAG: helix-turn-helix domain-containing protein [Candidatus Zeuxoniibacter abyssi]|nr:MAG: helix-turn-helix domain-containing protein [Candidatus Persebacteraceae bacterium AB1(2)]